MLSFSAINPLKISFDHPVQLIANGYFSVQSMLAQKFSNFKSAYHLRLPYPLWYYPDLEIDTVGVSGSNPLEPTIF
jgi:hypothetical protein